MPLRSVKLLRVVKKRITLWCSGQHEFLSRIRGEFNSLWGDMKEISRKDIEEAFKGFEDLKLPSIEHYEGNGQSIWTIKIPGSVTIHTGDAGIEEFRKAVKRDMETWKDKK